jgi:PAS domain S-box-containing protein
VNKELKTLIVEDSSADAELAVAMLSRSWEHVAWRVVDRESDFINELSWHPDVIIADYEVPGFSAPVALEMLQELDADIPLIVCTGAVTEETVVRCMRLGAADYLLKDRLTRLAPAIENALAMRRERLAKQRIQQDQVRMAALNSALLDSLPAQAALLDCRGDVIATSAAWRTQGNSASFSGTEWGCGCHYVQACRDNCGKDNLHARGIARGVSEVLAGKCNQFSLEYPCQNRDGKHWFRFMVTSVTSGSHDGGAVVMHVDVTEHRSIEEQHKINANALQHLAEGVIVADARLRVISLNKAYTAMTGYELDEVKGLPLWMAITGEERDRIPNNLGSQLMSAGGWRTELETRRKDGRYFHAVLSVNSVPGAHGEAEHFTAVLNDHAWTQRRV